MKTAIALLVWGSALGAQMQSGAPTTSGRINVGDAELAWSSTGSGRAIVFLHGWTQSQAIWDDQVKAFADRYRVIRYDLRGFGASTGYADISADPDDLRILLDSLGVARAHVVGLSLGADVALRFALLFPDRVDGLVLYGVGPTPDVPGAAEAEEQFKGFLRDVARKHGLDSAGRILVESPVAWIPPDRPALKAMFYEHWKRYDGRDLLDPRPISGRTPEPRLAQVNDMKLPTLLLNGDHDIPELVAFGDTLARRIPAARRVVIRDAGHGAHFARPEEFNRALADFFRFAETSGRSR